MLVQAVAKDLVKRGGIRAVEAFGDARAGAASGARPRRCVLPADYLLAVGFKTVPAAPALPADASGPALGVTWREDVEAPSSGCWAPYARRGTRSRTRPAGRAPRQPPRHA